VKMDSQKIILGEIQRPFETMKSHSSTIGLAVVTGA
jgi:hypothetical protein